MRYDEAAPHLRRATELGPESPLWTAVQREGVPRLLRRGALSKRLPAVRARSERPKSPQDALELAVAAYQKRWHGLGTRLRWDALREDPSISNEQYGGSRFGAACSAALYAAGRAEDDPSPIRLRSHEVAQARPRMVARGPRVLEEPGRAGPSDGLQPHGTVEARLGSRRSPGGSCVVRAAGEETGGVESLLARGEHASCEGAGDAGRRVERGIGKCAGGWAAFVSSSKPTPDEPVSSSW